MWIRRNENPAYNRVGDCVIRSISTVLNQSWEETYVSLCVYGFMFCDMPSSNAIWALYLADKGFSRKVIDAGNTTYTVEDFCKDHPSGSYLLGTGTHAVAAIDGNHYDTWDSGNEQPIYYFEREE